MIVMRTLWTRTVVLFLLIFSTVSLRSASQAEDYQVDLALVLAIDCSFSVDSNEFRLQMEGLGRAFLHRKIHEAISQGATGRIAVTALQWSDESNQMVIVPWTIISNPDQAEALGQLLARMPRRLAEGGTSISTALQFSAMQFEFAPSAERRVIDISSDGRNNIGPPVNLARDRVVARGITINALTILNEWPTLDQYFERNVVGGQGHFVIPAEDYVSYADAIYRKLLREIVGPGIS
ncbi:MAG: DUF1194 domain-containing protein [Rhizobiales bacterium]|nr:DUF1194 domain-containing protein [Hyphomicrobiales bacterium]